MKYAIIIMLAFAVSACGPTIYIVRPGHAPVKAQGEPQPECVMARACHPPMGA